jgi:hypothetical protein
MELWLSLHSQLGTQSQRGFCSNFHKIAWKNNGKTVMPIGAKPQSQFRTHFQGKRQVRKLIPAHRLSLIYFYYFSRRR